MHIYLLYMLYTLYIHLLYNGYTLYIHLYNYINVINIFGPLSVEDTPLSTAISAIIAYCVFAIIAYWLDKKRTRS